VNGLEGFGVHKIAPQWTGCPAPQGPGILLYSVLCLNRIQSQALLAIPVGRTLSAGHWPVTNGEVTIMARFTLYFLNANGTPRVHSTHETLPQAVNQTGTAPPGRGWRIVDTLTGQVLGTGVGKVPASKVKPTKPAIVKMPVMRTPPQPKGRRSRNAGR
jgi:hypothetical protein